MTFLEACRAFKANGGLPCHVSVLLEGEEETGSPSLPAFLAKHAKSLKADLLLVCDTYMWSAEHAGDHHDAARPGVRGGRVARRRAATCIPGFTAARRSIRSACSRRIFADLHDDKGAVTLPGFYDGVEELPDEIAAQWRDLDFDPAKFLGEVGLSVPAGENGRCVLEMLWSRPTCDVQRHRRRLYRGGREDRAARRRRARKFRSGWSGKQNPDRIQQSFRAFVKARLPADVKVEFLGHGG